MDDLKALLSQQNIPFDPLDFVVNLVLAALLCAILAWAYGRFGRSLSNRERFASNFVLLGITTMVIISIVKSSLALSLGLVGALSIVRFRSAIKEPEELTFLFVTIAIGLGLGANQRWLTLLAFIFILATIVIRGLRQFNPASQSLFLSLHLNKENPDDLETIITLLKKHCRTVKLKRVDESDQLLEAAFALTFGEVEAFNDCRKALLAGYPGMSLTFLDEKVVV